LQMATIIRPALGQTASIGSLYDATSDQFLPASIIRGELPSGSISTQPQPNAVNTTKRILGDRYTQRFESLGVKEELATSILAGLVEPRGSGVYLRQELGTAASIHGAVLHEALTVYQSLGFTDPALKDHIDLSSEHVQGSTHMVTGINWGLRIIVATQHRLPDNVDQASIEDAFGRDLGTMELAISSAGRGEIHGQKQMELEHELTLYSDVLQDQGLVMQDLAEVLKFIELVPDQLSQEGDGKGWQASYTLLPLNMLQYFYPGVGNVGATLTPASPETLSQFVHLFDEFDACADQLRRYVLCLEGRTQHVADDHIYSVVASTVKLERLKHSIRTQLIQTLTGVRRGSLNPASLRDLYDRVSTTDSSPNHIAAVAGQELGKLEFANMAVELGANYLGHNGISPDAVITCESHGDQGCYLFLFNHVAMKDQMAWGDNCALLVELLGQPGRTMPVYIADYDSKSVAMGLNAPRICQFENGQEVVVDLVEHNKFLAGKCFARYREGSIDTDKQQKPVKRRFVRIPCPGRCCDQKKVCE
jgi:hypothetical protein